MKITNLTPGKPNEYTLADPCPQCSRAVTTFELNMGYSDYGWEFPSPVSVITSAYVVFHPCRCQLRSANAAVQDWCIVRCSTPQDYNRELIKRDVRLRAKKH